MSGKVAPSRLMVLLFTDIVRSVDLKTRLGDAEGARLIGRHDELFREVMGAAESAEILKDTGDGFLARFTTTREAVMVALRFQHAIWSEPWGADPIQVRIGIHLGEVSELELETTGLPKVSGLAVDIAARVMGLGLPGQILMTRAAFDNARQYVRHEGDGRPFEWMAHGRYLFQGADDAMEIFEVGAVGIAPLSVPPDGQKARRSVAAEEEETLGWRPASSLPVPGRKGWVLERKLGEGGFGEVWLAGHKRTRTRRVFKFCYDVDRLRSLKREMTLFRVLREALGERPDIARLYEVQLDEPPFFLESEFTTCGSLQEWAETLNGIAEVPLEARVELVARTARAAAAAHSVGILHKDIKPANILIYKDEDGVARPRLSDFGIGTLTDKGRLAQGNITVAGFTDGIDDDITTGTRMYAPPELLAGKPFTVLGDVYALGVLLYQMVVGDLDRPLAQGWERDVRYPLLREDIAACVEGDEQQRLGSAQGLAKKLETLPQRRRARRRRNIIRVGAAASAVLAVLLTVATVWGLREGMLRERAEIAADKAREMNVFLQDMLAAANPWSNKGPGVKVVDVLDDAAADLETRFDDRPEIKASLHATLGWTYKKLGWPDKGEPHLERAMRLREAMGAPPAELAQSVHELAAVKWDLMQYEQAAELYRRALAIRQELVKRAQDDPDAQLAVAETTNHLAGCLDRMDKREEAERFFREALHIRELLPEDHRDGLTMWGSGISWVYIQNNLATCLREQGKLDEAEGYFREVVDSLQPDAPSPALAGAMSNLAKCLLKKGELDEARTLLESAVAMKREVLEPDDRRLAISLHELGGLHLQRSAPAQAEPLLREALAIRRARFTDQDGRTAHTGSLLGECLLQLDRLDEAETVLVRSYPVLDAEYGSADERTKRALQQLIDVCERLGRSDEAQRYRTLQVAATA